MDNIFNGALFGFGFCIAVMIVALIIKNVPEAAAPLDSTDDHITGTRSGMRVVIDHGTGLQYLIKPNGGITPRLDADGNVMKVKE